MNDKAPAGPAFPAPTPAAVGRGGPPGGGVHAPATPRARGELTFRLAATAALLGGYYWFRERLAEDALAWYAARGGGELDPATPRILGVSLLIILLVVVWRKVLLRDPRYHAPLLVTTILAVGDAAFGVLENHTAPPWLVSLTGGVVTEYSPTFVAIVATILVELALGRFFWGKWPHLASAYISGISVGILIKSPALWPFILCGLISIASKYVLRVGDRHIWNPSNFGVTMMLLLAPASVASLTVQAGDNGWAVVIVWVLGGLIMYKLGRFHIPLAFLTAFVPLAFLRSYVTGHPWQTELAPITSPVFQLYIFFMITDPKTTTRARWSQVLVAGLVAGMETFLRLAFKDVHSFYHALFIVGPATNLVEIFFDRRKARAARPATPAGTVATPGAAPAEAPPAEVLARG